MTACFNPDETDVRETFTSAQFETQEAQLSRTGRAMLRVIEYFAQSLNVTQGH